ncbi:MAG: hypothetical protein R6X12_01400 [bacterium]
MAGFPGSAAAAGSGGLPGWAEVALVAFTAAAVLFITRRFEFVGLTAVPLAGFFVLRDVPAPGLRWPVVGVLVALAAVAAWSAARHRLFARTDRTREQVKLWRFLIRPAAMAFPALLFIWSRVGTVILLAAVTAAFLALDLTRLSAGRVNRCLFRRASGAFKTRERDRLSSMTLFLVAALLVTLVFSRAVALYAVAYMVFGDFAAKFFGLWFGRTRLFSKTVEGTLGHLVACLSVGAVLAGFVPLPLPAVALAAVVATGAEALPIDVDDNLTVGVSAAAALHFLARLFG